jgi:hypothetical protein
MTKRVLAIREESDEEKALRLWFLTQSLETPKTLDDAARLMIGLVSGLLGALFGALAIGGDQLPAFITSPLVRYSSLAAVALWLLSLIAGLAALIPLRSLTRPGRPLTQPAVFAQLVRGKSIWLTVQVIAFGLAAVALAVALAAALLLM